MKKQNSFQYMWLTIDWKRACIIVLLVLTCSFMAFFLTASRTEAKKQERTVYAYYTLYTVAAGDSLWEIAEQQLSDPDTASQYASERAYIDAVLAVNRVQDMDYLEAGETLVLPYYSSLYRQ